MACTTLLSRLDMLGIPCALLLLLLLKLLLIPDSGLLGRDGTPTEGAAEGAMEALPSVLYELRVSKESEYVNAVSSFLKCLKRFSTISVVVLTPMLRRTSFSTNIPSVRK